MFYNSPYTVADVRSAMQSRTVKDSSLFIQRLNEVLERLNDLGLFKQMLAEAVYPGGMPRGYITLARRHLSAVGYNVNNVPMPIYSSFHEYHELGVGYRDPSQMQQFGLIDMGDGYPTQADIETAGPLRVKIYNVADAGKVLRIFGKDDSTDPQTIYDSSGNEGIQLTTANPTAATSQVFSTVYSLQLPVFVGRVDLFVTNDGTDTQIGTYEPGETRPSYRRYKGGISSSPIRVFCRRRFIPVSAETDPVVPGHLGALEFGMRARIEEIAYNDEAAMKLWALAEATLDKHVKAIRGVIRPVLPFDISPVPGPIRYVR